MINQTSYALGANRSCIRDLFEYGRMRAAIVGNENVYDYSLGNPSIPSPKEVDDAIRQILLDTDTLLVHGYTSAVGDLATRKAISEDLNGRYGCATAPEDFFIGSGAAPELVAGTTARIRAGETFLEYDGVCVETGPLNEDGLTPISAVPALLEAVRSAYINACCFEDSGLLRCDCGSPDLPPGTGTEYVLWFHPDTHELVRGEISTEGFRCIECTFSPFTKE